MRQGIRLSGETPMNRAAILNRPGELGVLAPGALADMLVDGIRSKTSRYCKSKANTCY
jgi:hypothetical protein